MICGDCGKLLALPFATAPEHLISALKPASWAEQAELAGTRVDGYVARCPSCGTRWRRAKLSLRWEIETSVTS